MRVEKEYPGSIRAVEDEPVNSGVVEDVLRGLLERVDRLVDSDSGLPCLVIVCKVHTLRVPGGFRAVLKLFFDDLFCTLLVRRFGC